MISNYDRISDIRLVDPVLQKKMIIIRDRMRVLGFDLIFYETLRTSSRQRMLFEIGRRGIGGEHIVTNSIDSEHIHGRAVDCISKTRKWKWPEFYKELAKQAKEQNLRTLGFEGCHVQMYKRPDMSLKKIKKN